MRPRDRRGTWRCPDACLYVAMFSKCRHQSESNEQSPGPFSLLLLLSLPPFLSLRLSSPLLSSLPSFSILESQPCFCEPSRIHARGPCPLGSIHNIAFCRYKFKSASVAQLIIDLLVKLGIDSNKLDRVPKFVVARQRMRLRKKFTRNVIILANYLRMVGSSGKNDLHVDIWI